MECNCGATTQERCHTKSRSKVVIAKLTYDRCPACGRKGNYKLTTPHWTVTDGAEAQAQFEELSNNPPMETIPFDYSVDNPFSLGE